MGLAKALKILIILCLLTFIAAGNDQLKTHPDERPKKKSLTDYVEMTRILSQFYPGINYNELHARYREENPPAPFDCSYQYTLPIVAYTPQLRAENRLSGAARSFERSITDLSKILVIVNSSLYADRLAREGIDRYIQDIHSGYGCEVTLITAEGGQAEDIKSVIHDQYSLNGLDGAVFIGQLPAAWFEVPNDHYWWEGGYGYADWTCDLFFMDMDGLWEDLDDNGKYDSHTDGQGDIDAEIFVGRIDTSTMSYYATEIDLFHDYLNKDHEYWTGNVRLYRLGLVYTDHDWTQYNTYYFRHLYGIGNYDDLKWQDSPNNQVQKFDYLNNRLPFAFYGFTQVWTHSTYEYHKFHTGGICYEREVHDQNPMSIGYNIDGCHACDWAAGGGKYFLGGGYIYNGSPSSLVVIGTTKVGGMLEFDSFYQTLGQNNCIGQAFLDWFNDRLNSDEERGYIIGWHYGMTTIGDPLIAFLEIPGFYQPEEEVKPPLSFSGKRVENRSLLLKEYIDVLTWQANPGNEPGTVTGYRLYEVTKTDLIHMADVNRDSRQYLNRKVENRAYRYAIAALDRGGQESCLAFTMVE